MPFETWRRIVNQLTKELSGAGGLTTGALPSPPDYRDYKYNQLVPQLIGAQIPGEVDYRPNLPPVWNQGQFGTCVAAASCWSLKAYHEMVQGDFPGGGLSVAYLYAMCKQYDGIQDQPGTYPRVALKIMREYGVCTEQELPYSWLTSDRNVPAPPASLVPSADKYKIKTYAQVCGLGDKTRDGAVYALKRAIFSEGVVLAALLVCSNFLNPKDGMIPLPGGRVLGGHAVALVGYSEERQAFLLRNSWGEKWGDGGYAWLPYEWLTSKDTDFGYWHLFEAWTAVDVAVPQAAKQIELTIGQKLATVDGIITLIDQEPIIMAETGRTLVPLRFVIGNMGYLVNYDAQTKKITLIKPN
jgi:C1A family cysteine protease